MLAPSPMDAPVFGPAVYQAARQDRKERFGHVKAWSRGPNMVLALSAPRRPCGALPNPNR